PGGRREDLQQGGREPAHAAVEAGRAAWPLRAARRDDRAPDQRLAGVGHGGRRPGEMGELRGGPLQEERPEEPGLRRVPAVRQPGDERQDGVRQSVERPRPQVRPRDLPAVADLTNGYYITRTPRMFLPSCMSW